MDFIFVLIEMHKGLVVKRDKLTPLSSKIEQEDYLKSLQHYKKIFQTFSARINEELYLAIEKAHKNIFELSGEA
jgi:hypothetical protein